MPYAALGDVTLYYEEVGTGEPLLLVAGQGADHHLFDDLREDFASRYRVIVHDYRGTGQSDKPTEPAYSTRGFARDIARLLDHLQIPRAHAYGGSMGGRVCQWLGIDYPDRVGSLVLGCTTPGNAHGIPRSPEINAAMANPPADPAQRVAFLISYLVSPGWLASHPEYVAEWREQLSAPIPEHARRLHYLASEGHDSWDLLPTIKAPTLVIHGSEDLLNPTENAFLLAKRIQGAELHIVQGGRHGYHNEFREEATRVVLDFLARHPIGGAS